MPGQYRKIRHEYTNSYINAPWLDKKHVVVVNIPFFYLGDQDYQTSLRKPRILTNAGILIVS